MKASVGSRKLPDMFGCMCSVNAIYDMLASTTWHSIGESGDDEMISVEQPRSVFYRKIVPIQKRRKRKCMI